MDERTNSGGVQSLGRTLEIVEYIHDHGGARLGELTEDLGFARSTIYNHLTTLEGEGYLIKEANTYHLGLQFLHLGEYTRHRKPEYALARQRVNQLAEETNEEVDFTVPEHGRMISLYHSVGDQTSSGLQVGRWFHMHVTAAGKAVMAEMSDAEVEAIVDTWGLPARTDNTITDIEELRAELDQVRDRGYAINDQELLEGYHSIGVAVKYPTGKSFGALAVGGPTYRIQSSLESSNLIDRLLDAVDGLERDIAETPTEDANWWRQNRDVIQKQDR
jgi:DNA-binding IclR family transcriptional regulator